MTNSKLDKTVVVTPSSGNRGLTRKATLTFLSQTVLTFARAVSGLILTPVLLRAVGAELFGVWSMLQQLVAYISIADLRPSGALKYLLCNRQSEAHSTEERNRIISVAASYSLLSVPLFVALGLVVLSSLAHIVGGPPEVNEEAATVFAILFAGFLVDRIISIPNGILTAQNFGYAGTTNATIWILASIVGSVAALNYGYGLVGVATVTALSMVGRGIGQLLICLRTLPWVAFVRPNRADFHTFARVSGWLSLSSIAQFALASVDVLVIGALLGAKTAGLYAATALVPKAVIQVVGSWTSSGNAGLLALLSSRDLARVTSSRNELVAIALLALGALSPLLIIGNDPLLSAWIGGDHSAGNVTTMMVVALLVVQTLSRVDSVLLDGFAEIRSKAIWQCGSALIGLFGAFVGASYGLIEALVGFAVGNLMFGLFLQHSVSQRLLLPATEKGKPSLVSPFGLGFLWILLSASFVALTVSAQVGEPGSILKGLSLATVIASVNFAAIWLIAIPTEVRGRISERAFSAVKLASSKLGLSL